MSPMKRFSTGIQRFDGASCDRRHFMIASVFSSAGRITSAVVTGMLRAHGVEAWACDLDIVRQDWFKMIAFGGFRLVASKTSTADALVKLHQYRNGDLALPDDLAIKWTAEIGEGVVGSLRFNHRPVGGSLRAAW